MLHNLPQQYRKDPWVLALVHAISSPMEQMDSDAASIVDQMSLDKVTWNLPVEERVAGIIPAPGAAQEDRRSTLKGKWRSGEKVSLATLQSVAGSWNKGQINVAFTSGHIVVTFADTLGIPEGLDGLKAALRDFVPAHLQIDYIIKYNTWTSVAAKTWGDMAGYTWATAKESEIA